MANLTRRDANHAEIVAALRAAGCWVMDTAHVGGGFPDLVVTRGIPPVVTLLEVKDGRLPPSRRKLTEAEEKWHAASGHAVYVVLSVEDALRAVGLL